jgi:hypothetical protein
MKNTRQFILNESDRPQWWQRFVWLLRRHGLLKPGAPRFTGQHFEHAELVIRNFPPALGRAIQNGHK